MRNEILFTIWNAFFSAFDHISFLYYSLENYFQIIYNIILCSRVNRLSILIKYKWLKGASKTMGNAINSLSNHIQNPSNSVKKIVSDSKIKVFKIIISCFWSMNSYAIWPWSEWEPLNNIIYIYVFLFSFCFISKSIKRRIGHVRLNYS